MVVVGEIFEVGEKNHCLICSLSSPLAYLMTERMLFSSAPVATHSRVGLFQAPGNSLSRSR
jgi:hypothetical protein